MKKLAICKPQRTSKNLGGKANNLILLEQFEVQVPQWVVIPKEIMLEQLPENLDSANVVDALDKLEVPQSIFSSMEVFFGPNYRNINYAVRSSAVDEDGNNHSFAGQFETKLNVNYDELSEKIIEVWKSVASNHVLSYRKENKLNNNYGMAVIIQEMIQADVSGVAFGMDPVSGNTSKKVISAVYGLGEGLVSGELNADNYTHSIDGISKNIAIKENAYYCSQNDSGISKLKVKQDDQVKEVLNEHQVVEISKLLDKLNLKTGKPQDIEFAYANGQLHLLQTRPITTSNSKTKEEYNLWDNSNIIESYPGITTPLTFTFISKMYEAVYKQLTKLLGVSKSQIIANDEVFKNTLGLVRGRVYYNLINWYKMLAMVPGYSLNAEYMETMMGVKESFDLGDQYTMSKTKAWFRTFAMLYNMIKQHIALPRNRRKFQKSLNVRLKNYRDFDFSKMSVAEIIDRYRKFESTLLKEWKAPLVNDFFSMIWFGMLKKEIEKLFPNESNLHNGLLCGSKDIISVQPIHRTFEITKMIKNDPIVYHLFENVSAKEIWAELTIGSHPQIYLAITKYLEDFGERCIGELKLETISYNHDPTLFVQLLKNYLANKVKPKNNQNNIEDKIRQEAEHQVYSKLKNRPFKKWWLKKLISKTRDLVSNRENLRYERTRAFGIVRSMFFSIGDLLKKQEVIQDASDIFYLELEEILELQELSNNEIITKVKKRKAEFAAYQLQEQPKERFFTYGNTFTDEYIYSDQKIEKPKADLQGIGCCPGQVKAKVQVVMDPKNVESLNGDILVTSSTDPGWVTLFPSASAIIVERGSLLSHSAIVSREMGIPCIVGVDGLLRSLKTGDEVLMDGNTGKITLLNKK